MRQRRKSTIKKTGLGLVLSFVLLAGPAWGHTPLCSCYDNGNGRIMCEGGFSDGSSASGVKMRIVDGKGKVLINGAMDKNSTFEFDKPKGAYKVIFDAGPGHDITIDGSKIVE